MGKVDKLKTAKMSISSENMSHDGFQDKRVSKPKKKERQKGKQIIKEELKDN